MSILASQLVASIPEILRHISDFSTTKDNVRQALVCKTWSNEALGAYWRIVDDDQSVSLFSMLAPLEKDSDGLRHFARRIHPVDWVRFDKYSWRVQVLRLHRWEIFDSSVYTMIATSRPRLNIFPNLRALGCMATPHALPLFSHPSVKNITLYSEFDSLHEDYPDESYDDLKATIPFISRMPHLQVLTMEMWDADVADCQIEAATALRQLSSLREVHIACHWLTPLITESLASHPLLNTIDALDFNLAPNGDRVPEELLSPTLSTGSFPALEHVAIAIRFSRATKCLPALCGARSLTFLDLWSPDRESALDYVQLLRTIGSSCPALQYLRLFPNDDDYTLLEPNFDPLPSSVLRPIFSCRDLRNLELRHFCPLELDGPELLAIFKAFPLMRSLILNPGPIFIVGQPTLNLSALSTAAQYCKNLVTLELYLDASPEPSLAYDNNAILKMMGLKELNVGCSWISNPKAVSSFLDYLLPDDCRMHHMSTLRRSNVAIVLKKLWNKVRQSDRARRIAARNLPDDYDSGVELRKVMEALRTQNSSPE